MTADKKDECSQMASDNQLGLSGPGLGAPGLVISTNLPDAIREQMKADPLKRRRSHVEWLDAAELAGALARFPGMMAFDEDEALAVWADIRRAVLSNALADDMFKVTEEVAIDEGGGNLDDALTIELTQAGAKFYLKHGGHQNAGRVYIEWFGIEDLPKIEIPKMPSQQQFQQNMEVMSGHDHSEGYDYHSVKEALDDFLTKACSDPGDTELDKIMHGMSFLSGVLSAYKLICPGHPNVDDAEELISSTSARLKEAGKEVSGSTAAGKRRLN